jgi:hypothetical protein
VTPHPSNLDDRLVPSTEWVVQGMRDGKWAETKRGGIYISPNVDTTCFTIRQVNQEEEDDLIHICDWPELRATIDQFMADRAKEAGL